jgi:hypothetical protein
MESEFFCGEDFYNLTDAELQDTNRGRIYCKFLHCWKCFKEFVKKYKFKDRRIICYPNEDWYCTIAMNERYDEYNASIGLDRWVEGWTCDSCEEEKCPSCDLVGIMYMDKKLPLEIQAEIKSLEIHGQIMYGPRSQAYRDAMNNFENICKKWKTD